jgi:hypothetical protein
MTENPGISKIAAESDWYGKKSQACRTAYLRLKTIQIVMTGAIPAGAAFGGPHWISATLGALVGIAEGILQIGRYQENWLLYRATRQSLKREDLLYASGIGPYSGAPDPERTYIERAGSIISGEQARWLSSQQAAGPATRDGTVN